MTTQSPPPAVPPEPEDELVRKARSVNTAFNLVWPTVGPLIGFVLTMVGAYEKSPELITAGTGLLSGGGLLAMVKTIAGRKS